MAFQFWTADHEGNKDIEKWLRSDAIDGNPIPFYASFVNWCHQQVSRARDRHTKYEIEADKERAHKVWDVLRQRPLDTQAFIRLMEEYLKSQYRAGDKHGYISQPVKVDTAGLAFAHKRLKQIVWDEAERTALTRTEGGEWALSKKKKRRMEYARQKALAEAQESESALGQYEGVQSAVSSIEAEPKVDEAPAGVVPWVGELVDRTKE